MKHTGEKKCTLREAYGATSRWITGCVGAVALVMAMLLLVSCSDPSVTPEESSTAEEQGNPAESTTAFVEGGSEPSVDVPGATDEPAVRVGTATAKAGETVQVMLYFENNPGIMAFDFGFEYDTERLQIVDATVLPEFGEDSEYNSDLVWVGLQDTTYNGAFAVVTFQVLTDAAPGDATINVTFQAGDVCNYNEEDVTLSVISGKVTVTE